MDGFRFSVDQITTEVDKLEKQVNVVAQFYHSLDKEEKGQLAEEAHEQMKMKVAEEARYANMARNLTAAVG
ncbi:hypothetical protein RIF29_04043 [Crotalaria pallida]|uniref:Uncharacterized protein n=1 Tax=Crotalaria pallida TaxID=3830 RepID=A0AAN9P9N0_CROPI